MSDITVTAANVNMVSGRKVTGTAGATITAGQSLYADASDSNKLKLADASAASTDDVAGISLHAAASGQPVQYQESGILDTGATLIVGTFYVLSATAGGIAPWADLLQNEFVTLLGMAVTTNNLDMGLKTGSVQIP